MWPVLIYDKESNQQDVGSNHRRMSKEAQLEELRKVFTVKRERPPVERSDPLALSTQRTRKRKSSLRTLRRIL